MDKTVSEKFKKKNSDLKIRSAPKKQDFLCGWHSEFTIMPLFICKTQLFEQKNKKESQHSTLIAVEAKQSQRAAHASESLLHQQINPHLDLTTHATH